MNRKKLTTAVVFAALTTLFATIGLLSMEAARPRTTFSNSEFEPVVVPVDALAVSSNNETGTFTIPEYARRLNRRKVSLTGMMYPTYEETGITQFFFIPVTKLRPYSWLSGDFPLHALIPTITSAGHAEDYQERPFTVEGVFEINVKVFEGKTTFVYRIRDARIVAKNQKLPHPPAVFMFGC